MKKTSVNLIILIVIMIVYVTGQFLIGTNEPNGKRLVFDAPADVDFLYYGAITNQLLSDFPPQNPSFAGERLTQPFLQFYPAALLAKFVNPFNAFRILNVFWLIIFAFLLRRYFPDRYGFMLAIIFVSSTLFAKFNSLGVDFIARGFTHIPFFILMTVAMFSKNRLCRLISIFFAPLINGYMMFMIGPALFIYWLIDRDKEKLFTIIMALGGMATASLFITSGVVSKPFYFIFTESFYYDPLEYLIHGAPFAILAVAHRNWKSLILLTIAVIFGSLIHYNPFFPIFVIYFSGALAFSDVKRPILKPLAAPITAILFIFFILAAVNKYNYTKGDYFARVSMKQANALEWIRNNTGESDIFAAINGDSRNLAFVMLDRPVYLGYIGHLTHLGIDCGERYNRLVGLYGTGQAIEEVDYIFYGPIERRFFPRAPLRFQSVYNDDWVTIYRMR